MKPHRVIVALGGASVVLAACMFPSLGDLVGGSDASAPGVDASIDAPTSDVTTGDVTVGDAGTDSASDAKIDAPLTDGASSSPCSLPNLIFCADFDKSVTFSSGWTNTYQAGFVAGALDKTNFVSPPASFAGSMTQASDGGGNTDIVVEKVFTTWSTKVFDVEFDVRADMASWAGLAQMDAVLVNLGGGGQNVLELDWQIDPTDPSTAFYVELDQNGSYASSTDILSLPAPVLKTWLHVRFHVDTNPATPLLSVFYDGIQVLAPKALIAGTVDPRLELHVGLVYLQKISQPWKLEFDNVVIR